MGITRGNFTREQFETLGAWRVIDSLMELPDLVRAENGEASELGIGSHILYHQAYPIFRDRVAVGVGEEQELVFGGFSVRFL